MVNVVNMIVDKIAIGALIVVLASYAVTAILSVVPAQPLFPFSGMLTLLS